MKLSVIIVSHNVQSYLEQCLYSLKKATARLDAEIWVVDNASSDGTVEWLVARFPEVRCIASPDNLGYARANNLPLPEISADYILFLNPDTILEDDCLDKCIAFMDSHADAGALGIRMLNGFGAFLRESKRGMPTALASLYKMAGLAERYPKHRVLAKYYVGHLDDYTTQPVPVLPGAFLLVKGKVIREVGSFDERFFMFGEDIDLSYRISKAGWNNYYFAESKMIHFKGQSTDKSSDAYLRHFYGAMTLFVKKYYRGPLAVLYRLLLQAGIGVQKNASRIFPKKPRHWDPETARPHYLIVGSVKDTKAFLQQYDPGNLLYFTLNTDETPIRVIHQHMGFEGSTPVLFCLGEMTALEAIEWVDQSGWEPPLFFHDMQSEGIVGPYKSWPVPFQRRPLL